MSPGWACRLVSQLPIDPRLRLLTSQDARDLSGREIARQPESAVVPPDIRFDPAQ